ncbi:hypothetical protein [Saccharopolyspora taberi]|uniref:Uncharacterized protein n=1 Tax=Saccharopolyspora taberi TaxID=60895 RepID=A0ABN3VFB6_9PSEU
MTSTTFYSAGYPVDPNQLVPGTRIRRYTDPAPRSQLDAEMPCCDRTARLPGDAVQDQHLVMCTPCGQLYEVEVIDELDGGYGAVFTVRPEHPVLARRRSTRR